MRPIIHPSLINGPYGDPAVYVEFLYEKRALLFDMGDLHRVPPRKLLRVGHVFLSHMHMDHFCGFDRLLRICLGRDKALCIVGPQGLIGQVEHKLAAYTWNLVQNYVADFALNVTELLPNGSARSAEFRCRSGFASENLRCVPISGGIVLDDEHFRVRATILDHGIPCLAFALEEKSHVNVWKNRVEGMGFRVGPWLREFKAAVLRGDPDDGMFRVRWQAHGSPYERLVPLGLLKSEIATIAPGQKVAYVTDARYSADNRRKIVALAAGADILFIEAPFLDRDAEIAARKNHLTAAQAGMLARLAKVQRIVPFHFSPRYAAHPERISEEAYEAFSAGEATPPAE